MASEKLLRFEWRRCSGSGGRCFPSHVSCHDELAGANLDIYSLFNNQERENEMIAYTMVGTNDLPRAGAFYDALFGPLGYKRLSEDGDRIAWGIDFAHPVFFATKPFDGEPATVGNGVMIALAMKNKAEVDLTHRNALKLGGSDEGAAGSRGPSFYCGYFRDLDGNKINLFCMT